MNFHVPNKRLLETLPLFSVCVGMLEYIFLSFSHIVVLFCYRAGYLCCCSPERHKIFALVYVVFFSSIAISQIEMDGRLLYLKFNKLLDYCLFENLVCFTINHFFAFFLSRCIADLYLGEYFLRLIVAFTD